MEAFSKIVVMLTSRSSINSNMIMKVVTTVDKKILCWHMDASQPDYFCLTNQKSILEGMLYLSYQNLPGYNKYLFISSSFYQFEL